MPPRNIAFALYTAKIETTDGTDSVPTALVNAIELLEPFAPDYDHVFKNDALNRVRGPVLESGDPMTNAGLVQSTERKAMLRGNAAIPTSAAPIELDAWFRSAGYAATYVATSGSETVTYTPVQSGGTFESMTEYYYRDGILYKHVGVRCADLAIGYDVGGAVQVTAKTEGRVSADSDVTTPSTGVFKTSAWPIAVDATTFTLDGHTAGVIRKWAHSPGNTLQRRDGVKSAGGIAGWWITKRNPTFSVTLEESTRTVKDWMALRNANTPFAISWIIGGTQYNIIEFAAARAFIRKVTPSDDNGLALITLEGYLRGATTHSLIIK